MSCCNRITRSVPGVVGTLAGSSLTLRWVIIDSSSLRVGAESWSTVSEAATAARELGIPGAQVVAAYV